MKDGGGHMVHVAVRNLTGEHWDVYMNPDSTVLDLKEVVAGTWQVPHSMQTLVLHDAILEDDEFLGTHSEGEGTTLVLTNVAEVEAALEQIASENRDVRRSGLLTLLQVKGNPYAIAVVCSRLEDEDETRREHAVVALTQVADKGDPHATLGVSSRLKHPDRMIRREATVALAQIVERGDPQAIAAVSAILDNEDPNIRKEVVIALTRIAGKGDPQAISALSARLEDTSAEVRREAATALALIVEEGDLQAIAAVTARLEHPNAEVKREAVMALAQISEKGNPDAITALSACLQDENLSVRREAMAALSRIAEKGDPLAISAVSAHIEPQSGSVRRETVVALTRIDPHAITAVGACLKHQNAEVRREAIVVLSQIAEKGDPKAIAMVHLHLQDEDLTVRKAAVKALDLITDSGNLNVSNQDHLASMEQMYCKEQTRPYDYDPAPLSDENVEDPTRELSYGASDLSRDEHITIMTQQDGSAEKGVGPPPYSLTPPCCDFSLGAQLTSYLAGSPPADIGGMMMGSPRLSESGSSPRQLSAFAPPGPERYPALILNPQVSKASSKVGSAKTDSFSRLGSAPTDSRIGSAKTDSGLCRARVLESPVRRSKAVFSPLSQTRDTMPRSNARREVLYSPMSQTRDTNSKPVNVPAKARGPSRDARGRGRERVQGAASPCSPLSPSVPLSPCVTSPYSAKSSLRGQPILAGSCTPDMSCRSLSPVNLVSPNAYGRSMSIDTRTVISPRLNTYTLAASVVPRINTYAQRAPDNPYSRGTSPMPSARALQAQVQANSYSRDACLQPVQVARATSPLSARMSLRGPSVLGSELRAQSPLSAKVTGGYTQSRRVVIPHGQKIMS